MSAIVQNLVIAATEQNSDKVARPRKPVLSGKFLKFQVFGLDFVNKLAEKGLLSGDVKLAQDTLHIFSSVDEQTEFYQDFLDNFKTTSKDLRKLVLLHNKPVKAPRAKKADKLTNDDLLDMDIIQEDDTTAQPTPETTSTVVAPKKRGGGRKKNPVAVVNVTNSDDIIAQLVSIGTTADPVVVPPVVQEAPPAKKTRKTKADPTSNDPPVKKGRAKKNSNPTPNHNPTQPVLTHNLPLDDDDDDELVTREFLLNGTQILVDDDNNVYDFNSHLPLGKLDLINSRII
jgi:hypothetical protein